MVAHKTGVMFRMIGKMILVILKIDYGTGNFFIYIKLEKNYGNIVKL